MTIRERMIAELDNYADLPAAQAVDFLLAACPEIAMLDAAVSGSVAFGSDWDGFSDDMVVTLNVPQGHDPDWKRDRRVLVIPAPEAD